MTDDRIKSCPFCGSLDLNFVEGSTFRWIVAECQSCGARCGETRVKTLGDQDPDGDKAAALAEWNRRAIEAECRVPEGYVPVPVEPSDSQLDVAVSFALNVRICSDYNWSAYMRDVYARMLAAAPKPEKAEPERKLNSEPTIAAPVAQEPTAFLIEGFDGNGKRVAAVIQQNADNARNSASVFAEHYPSVKTSGLYLAPTDQSAEVDAAWEIIAERDAEVRRLKTTPANKREDLHCVINDLAEQVREREQRIEELERQRNRLVTALQAETGKLVACEKRQAVLVEALEEARDEVVGWAAYASEYFQQKHNLRGYVEKLDTTLASVKGNAEVSR